MEISKTEIQSVYFTATEPFCFVVLYTLHIPNRRNTRSM